MGWKKSLTQSRKDAKNTHEAAPCRFEVEDLARVWRSGLFLYQLYLADRCRDQVRDRFDIAR
jgi:hypothetical protein